MHLSLLSTDLILLILEVTDPESLLQFCRASRCIYYLVMDTKALRYQVELALSGMKDGPPSPYPAPVRLEQLLNYKRTWPALAWSHEDNIDIASPTIIGVSGGFIYHASENSDSNFYQWTLELYELRSFKLGRTDSHLRYLKFNVPFDIKAVVIDPAQNLLVLVELDQPVHATPVCARLHFRDLWTCAFHASACAGTFTHHTDWWGPMHMGQLIWIKQVEVCGRRVALSIRSETEGNEGITDVVVVDWQSNKAKRWCASLMTFQFVCESRILIAAQSNKETSAAVGGRPPAAQRQNVVHSVKGILAPSLLLCDTSNFDSQSLPWLRVYRLPDTWNNISSMDFRPNSSPTCGGMTRPGVFFYPDPCSRIMVLSVGFDPNKVLCDRPKHMMLVVEESLFQPPSRSEPTILAWAQWGQRSLLHEISDQAYSFNVIGRRLFHLETIDEPISARRRLRVVDFNPRTIARDEIPYPPWGHPGHIAKQTNHIQPDASLPYARSNAMIVLNAVLLGATEDNLVLFDEDEDTTSIKVLTFGKNPDDRVPL